MNLDSKFDLISNAVELDLLEPEVDEKPTVSVISYKEFVPDKMATVNLYVDGGYTQKAEKAVEQIKELLTPKNGDILFLEVGDTMSKEGWSAYVKDVVPQFGQPKLVITFGMFSTLPFFKTAAKDNPRWFDNVHTRLHEKSLGEHKFLLFVFPSMDTCLDPEFKSLMNQQIKMVRGLVSGLEL